MVAAREVIDGRTASCVTPGFVNGHVHITGEPITRGAVPDDTDWHANVFGWLIPTYLAQNRRGRSLSATLCRAGNAAHAAPPTFVEAGTILDL
ncbi:MAG: hypothetical protein QM744_02500 [Mesorhizobium sp.]